MKSKVKILFLMAEAWPTFRADVAVLFGKYLPRYDVQASLLTERGEGKADWQGGSEYLFEAPKNKILYYFSKSICTLWGLIKAPLEEYSAVQVRDMPVIGAVALIIAKWRNIPFIYWMSFPQSEGQVFRARARGPRAGLKYWFPLIQGKIGQHLLYRFIFPRCEHIFVQSDQMVEDVAAYGIARNKMTPVPMGVDLEVSQTNKILPIADAKLLNKRVLVYLGTQDRARSIEVLFAMLAIIKQQYPDVMLVLAGDTEDKAHASWLREQAQSYGVGDDVLWTGWQPAEIAWGYVAAAEIGISPFPRSFLLDSASPTKAVEYMAIGLPVVANDNPDQKKILKESQGGLCVPLDAQHFAKAVMSILDDPESGKAMGDRGRIYIEQHRGYDHIAMRVAQTYKAVLRAE
ncbi:glycosyltransferase [Methylobacillus pratensis]